MGGLPAWGLLQNVMWGYIIGYILWSDISKMDLRFGIWNVSRLCMADSLKTIARELGKQKLGLVAVQGPRWNDGNQPEDNLCIFLWQWKC
jgi:hypothetical protein